MLVLFGQLPLALWPRIQAKSHNGDPSWSQNGNPSRVTQKCSLLWMLITVSTASKTIPVIQGWFPVCPFLRAPSLWYCHFISGPPEIHGLQQFHGCDLQIAMFYKCFPLQCEDSLVKNLVKQWFYCAPKEVHSVPQGSARSCTRVQACYRCLGRQSAHRVLRRQVDGTQELQASVSKTSERSEKNRHSENVYTFGAIQDGKDLYRTLERNIQVSTGGPHAHMSRPVCEG